MSSLHVDSVRKHIGYKQLLNDIFLSCQLGEVVGILGRNGSGKSTLLKIIFGSLKAENKYVAINGKKIDSLSHNRNLITYLPQDHFLPNHLKINTIINLFCKSDDQIDIKEHILVKPYLNSKTGELSGGQLRMLEILITLYSNAEFLLLDEPFNGLSPLYTEIVKEMIIQRASQNNGIILTDHNYRSVCDIASKIILLKDGNIKLVSNFQDLVDWEYLPKNSLP